MTGVAASETFTGTRGMSLYGRKYGFTVSVGNLESCDRDESILERIGLLRDTIKTGN